MITEETWDLFLWVSERKNETKSCKSETIWLSRLLIMSSR